MSKSVPLFKIYIGSNKYLDFLLTDIIREDSELSCKVDVTFELKKNRTTPYGDTISLSNVYFDRYEGVHYDFKEMQVAFSGAYEFPMNADDSIENGGKTVLIVSIVAGGVLLIAIVACVISQIRKRKLQKDLTAKYSEM